MRHVCHLWRHYNYGGLRFGQQAKLWRGHVQAIKGRVADEKGLCRGRVCVVSKAAGQTDSEGGREKRGPSRLTWLKLRVTAVLFSSTGLSSGTTTCLLAHVLACAASGKRTRPATLGRGGKMGMGVREWGRMGSKGPTRWQRCIASSADTRHTSR